MRGRRRRRLLVLAVACVAAAGAAAFAAAGCGSSPDDAQVVAPYLGVWDRIEGGQVDPSHTIVVRWDGETARLLFIDAATGVSALATCDIEDGALTCTLPDGAGETAAPSPAPVVPQGTKLQLTLDQADQQLVVDRVLDDGTTEPVWIYERESSPPAATPLGSAPASPAP